MSPLRKGIKNVNVPFSVVLGAAIKNVNVPFLRVMKKVNVPFLRGGIFWPRGDAGDRRCSGGWYILSHSLQISRKRKMEMELGQFWPPNETKDIFHVAYHVR